MIRLFAFGAAILLLWAGAPQRSCAQFEVGVFVPAGRGMLTEAQFQQLAFGNIAKVTSPRDWAERTLNYELDVLELRLRLSAEQRRKLQLAGRGDIKECFDRVDELRERAMAPNWTLAEHEALLRDLRAAAGVFQGGLFVEGSLFRKTLERTLSAEQRVKYAALVRERRISEIDTVLATWERRAVGGEKLPEAKRKQLAEWLVDKTPPPRVSGSYAHSVILLQIAEFEADVLPAYYESDRVPLARQLAQAQQMEPELRQMGFWPPPTASGDDAVED